MGTGRPAPAMRTILELGVEFDDLQTGADLTAENPAKSPTPPCSSEAARVDPSEVLGAIRSSNMPDNHTASGAAALRRPRAPSAAGAGSW